MTCAGSPRSGSSTPSGSASSYEQPKLTQTTTLKPLARTPGPCLRLRAAKALLRAGVAARARRAGEGGAAPFGSAPHPQRFATGGEVGNGRRRQFMWMVEMYGYVFGAAEATHAPQRRVESASLP